MDILCIDHEIEHHLDRGIHLRDKLWNDFDGSLDLGQDLGHNPDRERVPDRDRTHVPDQPQDQG